MPLCGSFLCVFEYDSLSLLYRPVRDVLKEIEQEEFEGFEYVNPLLMSKVEDV